MKTRNLYKGDIKRFNINKLKVYGSTPKILEYSTPIIKKDALFYVNGFGVLISIDYDTKLPDLEEAKELTKIQAMDSNDLTAKNGYIYYDRSSLKKEGTITKEEIKKLKKIYKK